MKIEITEDGFETIYSDKYRQTYHSRHGVLQEAEHVFLDGAGVKELIVNQKKCNILEVGFGTGFNFFLTAALAKKHNAELNFVTLENNLLSYEIFDSLNHDQIENAVFIRQHFVEWMTSLPENLKNGDYHFEYGKIKLTIKKGDALKAQLNDEKYDAVYLDAFSPEQNPELWTVDFLKKLFNSMRKNALMSTYSAKGSVRRAMQEAGFDVVKKPGPKGKREMLVAMK